MQSWMPQRRKRLVSSSTRRTDNRRRLASSSTRLTDSRRRWISDADGSLRRRCFASSGRFAALGTLRFRDWPKVPEHDSRD